MPLQPVEETVQIGVSVTPPAKATVEGYVTDADTGEAIAGATVSLDGLTAETDSNGFYRITDVEPGSYTVTASHPDYVSASTEVTLSAGETARVDFELERKLLPGQVVVTIVVKLFNLIPLAGVKVTADEVEEETDWNGEAKLLLNEGESYDVKVEAWWIHPKTFTIESAAEETIEVPVLPSILLWAAGSLSVGGVTYLATKNTPASLLLGGGMFSIWPIGYYILEKPKT